MDRANFTRLAAMRNSLVGWCFFLVVSAYSPFITTWRTTSTFETITLPLTTPLSFPINVDWGDTSLDCTSTLPVSHAYSVPGTYNVTIDGNISGFRFNNGGDKLKLIDIVSWGDGFFIDSTSTNVFSGCANLRVSASPNTQPVFLSGATLTGMFAASGINSALNWDLANVTSLSAMFSNAANFNQPLNFSNTQGVTDVSSMFTATSSFNSSVNMDTSNVVNMSLMFGSATRFNQPITFRTDNVTDMSHMFHFAPSFNQPLGSNFNTNKVTTMAYMFSFASSFNQPVNFDTSSLQFAGFMFYGATAFNHVVNFSTPVLTGTFGMFAEATSFNQPVHLNTSNLLTLVDSMFAGATAFNSPVTFTTTRGVGYFGSMFLNAVSFNRPVTFQTDNAVDLHQMFYGAIQFNQPINFNTSKVGTTEYMFCGALSFNQPIDFQADMLVMATNMFANTTSFNSPVVLRNTRILTSTEGMFVNAVNFSSTITISSTANVTNMNFMFTNVSGEFGQILANWSTDAVTNCSNFCEYCGLPKFPRCDPCGGSPRGVSSSRGFVCKCPASEPNCDLCEFVRVTGALQVDCLAPRPTPSSLGPSPSSSSNVIIISPLFNITHGDDHGNGSTNFVFTLPIDPQAYTELGKVSQPCGSTELSCEWQDPQSLEFRQSVTKSMVDMGSGIIGTECTCTHLTVFAIALRSERHLAPLCHASDVDYVLLSLYSLLDVCLLVQLARLVLYKLHSKLSMLQHCFLLLACALRIAFISAKPVIESLAGLVMLGLLPSAISLILFIYLMLTWTSLQFVTFSASPFARFRVPFILIVIAVLVLIIALVIAVAAQDDSNQSDVVVSGSYVLAALYAVVCALVLLAGFGLRRTFSVEADSSSSSRSSKSSPISAAALDWRAMFRWRVLVATLGLSSCLFLSACLWTAAVQTDIIVNDAATLGTTTAFYVSDWLSLCVLTWLLSHAISGAAARKRHNNNKSSSTLEGVSMEQTHK